MLDETVVEDLSDDGDGGDDGDDDGDGGDGDDGDDVDHGAFGDRLPFLWLSNLSQKWLWIRLDIDKSYIGHTRGRSRCE